MTNFRAIARELRDGGAAREVADPAALTAACVELLRDAAARGALATAAGRWHRANRGAVGRTLAVVREELARTGRAA